MEDGGKMQHWPPFDVAYSLMNIYEGALGHGISHARSMSGRNGIESVRARMGMQQSLMANVVFTEKLCRAWLGVDFRYISVKVYPMDKFHPITVWWWCDPVL